MTLTSILCFIFCIAFFQLSCQPDGDGMGPCLHIYEEPILHIEWARNAQTGSPLRTLILSDIAIDSIEQDPFWLIAESRKNIAALDSALVCNPPCAFGTQSGEYSFTVSGDGIRDTLIVCNPQYTLNKGGCPSSSNGGLRITLDLQSL